MRPDAPPRRGRVLRGDAASAASAVPPPAPVAGDPAAAPSAPRRGRVVPRARVEAERDAAALLEAATARAAAIDARAAAEAAARVEEVVRDARAAASTEFAAELLAVRHARARQDAEALDRVVELARLLAERLVGEVLTLDPSRVVGMARDLVGEARGARRVRLEAHPDDAEALGAALDAVAPDAEILADPTLARGSLRLVTDVGRVDGRLDVRLERLAVALRAALD